MLLHLGELKTVVHFSFVFIQKNRRSSKMAKLNGTYFKEVFNKHLKSSTVVVPTTISTIRLSREYNHFEYMTVDYPRN